MVAAILLTGNDYASDVVARLFDFFADNSRWQRRLWNIGLLLALRELDEAIEGRASGALSGAAVKWQAEALREQVANDPGTGSDADRAALVRALQTDLAYEGMAHLVIRRFLEDVEPKYLPRWETVLRGDERPSRERSARALAAHLLDGGYSPQFLRDWLYHLVHIDSRSLELGDIVAEAHQIDRKAPQEFEVLVLYERTPPGSSPRPAGWQRSRGVRRWFESHAIDEERIPSGTHGGLVIRVWARDRFAAVDEAASIVDGLAARVAVGTRSSFGGLAEAFVAGHDRSVPLRRSRRVDIHSIDRHRELYSATSRGVIDSALELVSHLDSGPRAVAVAGGWSAIEFLLRGPGDSENVAAADRLAALVACSWPRAELTTIAKSRIDTVDDELSAELAAYATNRERCDRLVEAIRAETDLALVTSSDKSALHRMKRLVAAPNRVLMDVQRHAQRSLRALYRQRNLVLHGGHTRGVALEGTLRTAAPLVGAGMDRIAHAAITAGRTPLEAAARATFELGRAGSADAPAVTMLLE